MTVESLIQIGAVGIAGAIGAVARYLLGRIVAERTESTFPFGTLIINIVGAFLIGLIFALATKKFISPTTQTILATGFMGGFTTFSTMNWEGVQLTRRGNHTQSLLYFGSTFVLGISGCILGLVIGQVL